MGLAVLELASFLDNMNSADFRSPSKPTQEHDEEKPEQVGAKAQPTQEEEDKPKQEEKSKPGAAGDQEKTKQEKDGKQEDKSAAGGQKADAKTGDGVTEGEGSLWREMEEGEEAVQAVEDMKAQEEAARLIKPPPSPEKGALPGIGRGDEKVQGMLLSGFSFSERAFFVGSTLYKDFVAERWVVRFETVRAAHGEPRATRLMEVESLLQQQDRGSEEARGELACMEVLFGGGGVS
eukprot:1852989-Pyramimonas_sp.AAC.1